MSYDRKCLGLEKEEVDKLLASGEKSVVRFKASLAPPHSVVRSNLHSS